MRIKNWLLLLARMASWRLDGAGPGAAEALLAGAAGRSESSPTALGLVFDTSLSMEYKDKDKTRLDEAKERASEILKKTARLEPGLRGRLGRAGRADRAFARGGAEADRGPDDPRGRTGRSTPRMGQVYAAVAECDRPVHVVYVLTDLARSAWNPAATVEGLDKLAKVKVGRRSPTFSG